MIIPPSDPQFSWIFLFLLYLFISIIVYTIIDVITFYIRKKKLIAKFIENQRIIDAYQNLYLKNGEIPFNEEKVVDMDFDDDTPHGVYLVTIVKEGDEILGAKIIKSNEVGDKLSVDNAENS